MLCCLCYFHNRWITERETTTVLTFNKICRLTVEQTVHLSTTVCSTTSTPISINTVISISQFDLNLINNCGMSTLSIHVNKNSHVKLEVITVAAEYSMSSTNSISLLGRIIETKELEKNQKFRSLLFRTSLLTRLHTNLVVCCISCLFTRQSLTQRV